YNNYSATKWNGVTNWTGQVNLSTGSMPADTYRIVIETRDDAVSAESADAFFDNTDGTWSVTNTVTATVGTIVKPNTLGWSADARPAGATASFAYRLVGTAGPYTTTATTTANGQDQGSIAGLAVGNYAYRIEYRDSTGGLLRSGSGTFNIDVN